MLPCVCSVIDHRGRQNVVRTSVTHSAEPRVPLFCSYHILTSSVIYYWTDARQRGIYLLNRYWWNSKIFPFTKKTYLHRAQWRSYFYHSRVRILVSPWLLTCLANYKRASRSGAPPVLFRFHSQNGFFKIRFFCCRIFLFFVRICTFWNGKYKYYWHYVAFITSFITFWWQEFCDRWPL